jgi:hypothetical protein
MARLLLQGGPQGDPGEVLHDYVDVVVGLHHVVNAYDVGVIDHLQDLDLATDCPLSLRVADLHLLVGLYCDFSVLRTKNSHPH